MGMKELRALANAAYLAGMMHELGGVCFDEWWQRHHAEWRSLLKGVYDAGFCLGCFWDENATVLTSEQQIANKKGWEEYVHGE